MSSSLNRHLFKSLLFIGIVGSLVSQYMIFTHTFTLVTYWDGPSGGGRVETTEVHDLPFWVYPTQYFGVTTLIMGLLFYIRYRYFTHMRAR